MNPVPCKLVALSLFLALLSACKGSGSKSETGQPDSSWSARAADLAAEGDHRGAVLAIEGHLETAPEDAEAWVALGRALETFVDEGGGSFLVLSDARDAWLSALELQPLDVPTLEGAANIHFRLGEYSEASGLAVRAIEEIREEGETVGVELAILRVRARMGAFQNTDHVDLDDWTQDLTETLEAVDRMRRQVPEEPRLVVIEASFLEGLGVPERGIAVLEAGIEAMPGDATLHQNYINLCARQRIEERLPAKYQHWLGISDDATLEWYYGFAQRVLGDVAQRERDFPRARALYDSSIATMRNVAAREPSFADSAAQVIVQASVSKIWCDMEAGDLERANEELYALLEAYPDQREIPDGLGRSIMNAIASMGGRFNDLNRFEDAANLARAVVALSPDDGEWWNNLGFLLREYGTQMELGAIPDVPDYEARGREIFEESWQSYLRAAELKPDDARVVNDGALIQVYHLHTELERAEEILRNAIAMGEEQLAALGEEPDESDRFPLAQAVGDAYENLGYLYYHVYDKPQEARPFYVASIATDSGDRTVLEEYLKAIDGEREPVPLRDSSAFIEGPLAEAPAKADIAWEHSFARARDIAAEEGRPLVVYNRGAALGLSIPFLDTFSTGERFEERTRGSALAISDSGRHTFVDRTRDGHRLECPKWGAVTCGEHVASAEEFDSWYQDANGVAAGESEEGIWIQRSDEELHMLEGFDLFREDAPAISEATTPTGLDLDELEFALAGPEPEAVAAELMAAQRRDATNLLEAKIFDDKAPTEVRRALVAAVAADDTQASRDLLAGLVTQNQDRGLALVALKVWPTGRELYPVELAYRWSPHQRVRTAAREVLARDLEDFDRREAALALTAQG